MQALVTGGAGFIGSHVVSRLLARGDAVRILDDFSTGRRSNLPEPGRPGLEVIEGDLRDPSHVRQAASGAGVIYHLGALPSVARSVADPLSCHDVNAGGTMNVLAAAVHAGVDRVVFASSSSVYGDQPTLPKHEGMPVSPVSPYAASKLAGEGYCRAFAAVYGIDTVALRFFNVFGPRQDPSSEYAAVVPRFVTRMLAGTPPEIFGDGTQTRDFTFVEDAVDAMLLAGANPARLAGEAVNVAGGRRISLLELVETLNGVIGSELAPRFAPPRPGDIHDSLAAVERAYDLVGFRARVPLVEGLARTVASFDAPERPLAHAPGAARA